jgi:hypothetical protein
MLTAMCSRGGAGRHIAYPRHDKGGLEHHSLQAAFAS